MRKAIALLSMVVSVALSPSVYAGEPVACEDLDVAILKTSPRPDASFQERMDLMKKKHEMAMRLSECNRAKSASPVDVIQEQIEGGKKIAPGELKAWLEAKGLKKYEEYVCPSGAEALFGPADKDAPYGRDPGSQWWGFAVAKPTEVMRTAIGSRGAMVARYERLYKCKKKDGSNE